LASDQEAAIAHRDLRGGRAQESGDE
jgi:hypothetical protein